MYFVRFLDHSPEFYELIKQRPTAFVLLAIIADRARKMPMDINDGRDVGEALIGDYKQYGATPQSYRTDKKYLEMFKMTTFKTTNKGTIAKIVNSSIFDISRVSSTNKLTDQQQATNMQATTKQEVRSEIKERGASQAKPMEKKDFFHETTTSALLKAPNDTSNEDVEPAPARYKNTVSEEYWDDNAPRIAKGIGIDEYSDKYTNGKADWLMKAHTATHNSIEKFLVQANDGGEEDMSQDY